MPIKYSLVYWQKLMRKRLRRYPQFLRVASKEWFNDKIVQLRVASIQTSCHPLLCILCSPIESNAKAASQILAVLSKSANFQSRFNSFLTSSDHVDAWHRWNEFFSAGLVARSGFAVSFSNEDSPNSSSNPDYFFTYKTQKVAVEVTTVSDTPNRLSSVNQFKNDLKATVHQARKAGISGVFGGTIPKPERFKDAWTAVRYLMGIKQRSEQSRNYDVHILHILSSDEYFFAYDFLPDFYSQERDLRYRSSGRIYSAFYGIKGQHLYSRHFVGHPLSHNSHSVSFQKIAGRFTDTTSVDLLLFSLFDFNFGLKGALANSLNVVYTPLSKMKSSIIHGIIDTIGNIFKFDKKYSLGRNYPGPATYQAGLNSINDN